MNNIILKNWIEKKNKGWIIFSLTPVYVFIILLITLLIYRRIEDTTYGRTIAFIFPAIAVLLYFFFSYKHKNKDLTLNKTEKNILKILIFFLKEININTADIQIIIHKLFTYYRKVYIKELVEELSDKIINIDQAYEHILKQNSETKYFLIYSLMDISSNDQIFSIDEETIIQEIVHKIGIHKSTFKSVKNMYIKNGLKEERKILEEENRKKISDSFLPYNAYKILGVTPSIRKEQLKKVYRKLAKKYHPDKYHDQGKDVIENAEGKFREITEAYENIKKYKKFN